ncbi:LOW QUALITY PROTEIN: DNA (cytosine-5)-methyltransferase 3-like, partial [Galemys pyrenaicus]
GDPAPTQSTAAPTQSTAATRRTALVAVWAPSRPMALPCSRTPSLEALDGSLGPDAPEQPHPVRRPPCEIGETLCPWPEASGCAGPAGLEPDVEHSMDVILVDAAGPSAPVPPRACRGEATGPSTVGGPGWGTAGGLPRVTPQAARAGQRPDGAPQALTLKAEGRGQRGLRSSVLTPGPAGGGEWGSPPALGVSPDLLVFEVKANGRDIEAQASGWAQTRPLVRSGRAPGQLQRTQPGPPQPRGPEPLGVCPGTLVFRKCWRRPVPEGETATGTLRPGRGRPLGVRPTAASARLGGPQRAGQWTGPGGRASGRLQLALPWAHPPLRADLCLCCGRPQVHTQHPLFEGGMCAPCKDRYLDSLFLYDDDGYQALCSVCGAGEKLLVCESPDCTRCYCFECVDALVGPGTAGRAQATSSWVCFLCLPFPRSGLPWCRRKWRPAEGLPRPGVGGRPAGPDGPLETFKTVPAWKRQPVRVLSVFGDIRKELTSLGFLETGSDPGRFRHLEDVTDVVRRDVEGWGPFDLVFGSTPPAGHACARPPGWYLFQFHRLLQYARPRPGSPRPFFWMFVDSLALGEDSQDVATRFLGAPGQAGQLRQPKASASSVTVQDSCGRDSQGAVRVWSNIPAMRRHVALAPEEEPGLPARGRRGGRLPGPGPGRLVRSCFLPLREYFKSFPADRTSSLELSHGP